MKKSLKICSFAVALLILMGVLFGCKRNAENDGEDSSGAMGGELVLNGVSEHSYQIVRPDKADEEVIALAAALADYIKASTGYAISVTTDFEKGNYTTRTDYEILIGETNREESIALAELTYRDWAVVYKTTRVALYGESTEAIGEAIKYFEENHINPESKSIMIDAGFEKIYNYQYPVSSIKLAENNLEDYVIAASVQDNEAARYLQIAIAKYTGLVLNIVSTVPTDQKAIVVGKMNNRSTELLSALSFDEYLMQIEADGNVYLGTNSTAANNSYAVEKFVTDVLGYNAANDTSTKSGALEIAAAVMKEKIMNDILNSLKIADTKYLDELDAKANALKAEITGSANTVDPAKWKGTVYYVSNNGNDNSDGRTPQTAWKTLDKVNSVKNFSNGTAVLFERGGLWRGALIARSGVTYSSYGTGEKPRIYGSAENGANPANWSLLEGTTNIWVYYKDLNDVGSIVFNEGTDTEKYGYRVYYSIDTYKVGDLKEEYGNDISNSEFQQKMADEAYYYYRNEQGRISEANMKNVLRQDLYFFSNPHTVLYGNGCPNVQDFDCKGKLYVRCDKGNPGEVFDSIEFGTIAVQDISKSGINSYGHIVFVPDNLKGNPITIDNLCIKFGAAHGIGGGNNKGLTVTNCEIAWIGGTIYNWVSSGKGFYKTEALGNGVEVTRNCIDFTVDNNWIYQCFDTGITNQTKYASIGAEGQVKNITYNGNLIEYCDMQIELWLGGSSEMPSTYRMENLQITNNIIRFAGYGIGTARPNFAVGGAIFQTAWGKFANPSSNYNITGNIFYLTNGECQMLYIHAYKAEWLPNLEGNTYVDIYGNRVGRYHEHTAEDAALQWADHFSDYNFNETISSTIKDIYGDTTAEIAVILDQSVILERYKHMERDTWHQGVPKDNKY